jgi:hypothetical protein
MSEQNPMLQAVKSIFSNNFAAAQGSVQSALYAKAQALVGAKKQEIASTLVNQEVNDGGEERSGQG